MTQFRQHLPLLKQTMGLKKCSLEVTVMSWHAQQSGVKSLEVTLKQLDLENLKKLQVLHMKSPNDSMNLDNDQMSPEITSSPLDIDSNEGDELLSFIDFQPLDCTTSMLEGFFKAWLHDFETDWEHLHLIFPPLSSRSAQGKRITLKCDMQETMLSPTLLPGTSNFSLSIMGSSTVKRIPPITGKTSSLPLVPIHRLRVVKILQADGLCESVLFGLPLVVKPTSCWKLEWEDLESNRQFFHALCHTLQERQQFLLASYETISAVQRKACPVQAYFVLLPSPALTLLIKAVVSAELLLPCQQPIHAEDPTPDALRDMQGALDQLEVMKTYNPLQVKSLLDRHLQEAFGKLPLCNIPTSRLSKRQQQSISFQETGRTGQLRTATVPPMLLAQTQGTPTKRQRKALKVHEGHHSATGATQDNMKEI
uniref:meiosis 1 arrest protein-like n=2 Tax=Myxine glutinosa TaxID=7769 RepID=UPI00358FA20B